MRALWVSAALIALAACESTTAPMGAPDSPRHSYTASTNGDTIRAAALVVLFPNGNSLRFSSIANGHQVLMTATVSASSSAVAFTSWGETALRGTGVRFDTDYIGFGGPTAPKQNVGGDRSNGQALDNLITAFQSYGLMTNNTVALPRDSVPVSGIRQ